MQNTFKVGDKVKVVNLRYRAPSSLQMFIGKKFDVIDITDRGVTVDNYTYFYNDEIELVKEEPLPQEVVSTPKKNHAWGVFFEDGEFLRAFRTRQAARDWRDTQKFPIKKIKYEIV